MSLLPKILPRDDEQRQAAIERDLIREEAEIGAKLFGPIPKGHTRKFFALDNHSLIWYEAWKDKAGQHEVTTRYEVRPDGILKSQNGQAYQRLSADEAKHLKDATHLYIAKVTAAYRQGL
jgi:hypothetical protein